MPVLEKPVRKRQDTLVSQRGAFTPYAVAWLLGVPFTILLIVYMLRGH